MININSLVHMEVVTVCSCLRNFVPKYPRDWEPDWTNGCVRSTRLNCLHGDGFIEYLSVKLPDTRSSWYSVGMTLQECAKICLKNCSCMAYTTLDIREIGSGCLLWFDELVDIRLFNQNGQDLYVRMASSDLDEEVKDLTDKEVSISGKKRVIIVVVSTLFTGMLLLGLSVMLHLQKKKKNSRLSMEGIPVSNGKRGSANERQKEDRDLPSFGFITIAHATNDLSDNNKLGAGEFGPVYKFCQGEEPFITVHQRSKPITKFSIRPDAALFVGHDGPPIFNVRRRCRRWKVLESQKEMQWKTQRTSL